MTALRITPTFMFGSRRSTKLIERNLYVYKHGWLVIFSGFFEPLFYLLGIGFGIGALVGPVIGPGGQEITYQQFVAPALLASSAMNGAIQEATFNFFFKLNYNKTFASILSTPLSPGDIAMGELGWALLRGTIYAAAFLGFMVILGLVSSPWAILCLPTAMLIGFAFGGAGMAATTYMRSFVDFDYVNMALLPLFLFSGTFFPVSQYPPVLQWIVRCTPLYQGVALERAFAFGEISWALLVHVAYLAVMGIVGVRIAGRRLALLLQP